MSEEKEFLIVRIIVTIVTSIIVIMLFALLNCIIANAQVSNASISAFEIDGPNINWQIVNGLPQSPSGGIDYIGMQLAQGYNGTPSPVFTSGHSYDIEVIVNGSGWSASSTNVSLNKGIYFQNGGGNWIQATPDSQTAYRWGPNTDGSFYVDWHFTLDVTQNCTNILVNFSAQNFKVGTWSRGEIIITDLTSGDSAIISSINTQTEEMKENNNQNTDKIIQTEESIWNEYKGEIGYGEADIESSEKDRSGINSADSKEDAITYGYGVDNLYLDFNPPAEPYYFIWDLITEYIGIVTGLISIIVCINTLRLISQILGRRA